MAPLAKKAAHSREKISFRLDGAPIPDPFGGVRPPTFRDLAFIANLKIWETKTSRPFELAARSV
jgi:hypothetical protein